MSSTEINIDKDYSSPAQAEDVESTGCGLCCCQTGDVEKDGDEVKIKGLVGTRWSTLLMVMLWLVAIIFSRVGMGWSKVQCDRDHDDDNFVDDCVTNSGIYRISSVVIVLLAFQGVVSFTLISVYDSFWILKFVYLVGASIGLLVPAANFFDDEGYTFISRIGGLVFIIFMQTILLDFAYYWKKSWVDDSTVTGRMTNATMHGSDLMNVCKSVWVAALLVMSIIYIVIFVVAMSIMLSYFGGSRCGDNETIIIVSLVLVVAALVIQLFLTSNGSIIASGIVAAYVAYVTYAAVSLNPDRDCNPTLSTESVYGVGPRVIGLVIAFLSILWVSIMTTRRMAHIMGAGGITGSGMLNVGTGTHSGVKTSDTKEALKGSLRVTVMNLNVIFITLAFYISMILTNWGTIAVNNDSSSPNGGSVSMWMQAVGGWIAVGLYIVGLILPKFHILPKSIWDLQPEF